MTKIFKVGQDRITGEIVPYQVALKDRTKYALVLTYGREL